MRICYFGAYKENNTRNRLILSGLKENNIDIVFCHSELKGIEEERTGIKFDKSSVKRSIGVLGAVKFLLKSVKANIDLFIKFRSKNIDLIYAGYPAYYTIPSAKILSKIHGIPLVTDIFISLYDTMVFDRKLVKYNSVISRYLRFLDKWTCKLSDLCTLDTQTHIEYFKKEFKLKTKFYRVLDGAEKHFKPIKTTPNKQFKVFFYGKYTPLHGIEYIIQAAKILEKQNIEFILVGSGQTKNEILALHKKLKLKNVKFIDWVDYKELPKKIAEGDVILGIFGNTPKARRVIPHKVYDALAIGKAIITGDTVAAREILTNKENAILCKMSDSKSIADSILLLKNDKVLKQKIEKNALNLSRNKLDTKIIGKDLKQVLTEQITDFNR